MNLFRLRSEKEQGAVRSPRNWFVIAGNLYEAMSLIPEDFAVKAANAGTDTVAGPARVIGSTGSPLITLRGAQIVDLARAVPLLCR